MRARVRVRVGREDHRSAAAFGEHETQPTAAAAAAAIHAVVLAAAAAASIVSGRGAWGAGGACGVRGVHSVHVDIRAAAAQRRVQRRSQPPRVRRGRQRTCGEWPRAVEAKRVRRSMCARARAARAAPAARAAGRRRAAVCKGALARKGHQQVTAWGQVELDVVRLARAA